MTEFPNTPDNPSLKQDDESIPSSCDLITQNNLESDLKSKSESNVINEAEFENSNNDKAHISQSPSKSPENENNYEPAHPESPRNIIHSPSSKNVSSSSSSDDDDYCPEDYDEKPDLLDATSESEKMAKWEIDVQAKNDSSDQSFSPSESLQDILASLNKTQGQVQSQVQQDSNTQEIKPVPEHIICSPFTQEEALQFECYKRVESEFLPSGNWRNFPLGSRLFIGNLPGDRIDTKELFKLFNSYGRLAQISIKRAYGFVQYFKPEDCAKAIQAEQGRFLRGSYLKLEVAQPQGNKRESSRSPEPSSDRKRQLLNRKKPHIIPDVQIILESRIDRDFVRQIERPIKHAGMSVNYQWLPSRLTLKESLQDVISQLISEEVFGLVMVDHFNEQNSKVSLQIFHPAGDGGVRFDEYQMIDIPVMVELLSRVKQEKMSKINSTQNIPTQNMIMQGMMNQMNHLNNLNHMNNMGQINPMNSMNSMNSMNHLNTMNQMNNINHLNQINQMNQMAQMNQMNQLAQMNQMNHIAHLNPQIMTQMGQMNNPRIPQMNHLNHMQPMNPLINQMNMNDPATQFVNSLSQMDSATVQKVVEALQGTQTAHNRTFNRKHKYHKNDRGFDQNQNRRGLTPYGPVSSRPLPSSYVPRDFQQPLTQSHSQTQTQSQPHSHTQSHSHSQPQPDSHSQHQIYTQPKLSQSTSESTSSDVNNVKNILSQLASLKN